jgi:hypothetical protein
VKPEKPVKLSEHVRPGFKAALERLAEEVENTLQEMNHGHPTAGTIYELDGAAHDLVEQLNAGIADRAAFN